MHISGIHFRQQFQRFFQIAAEAALNASRVENLGDEFLAQLWVGLVEIFFHTTNRTTTNYCSR